MNTINNNSLLGQYQTRYGTKSNSYSGKYNEVISPKLQEINASNGKQAVRKNYLDTKYGLKKKTNNNDLTEKILTSSANYASNLENQRLQKSNTTNKVKKLKYHFKSISSKIIRSKTSVAARQAVGQARREIIRLNRERTKGDYDPDELELAIAHAKSIERVARKKYKHLVEEESAIAGSRSAKWQVSEEDDLARGDSVNGEENLSNEDDFTDEDSFLDEDDFAGEDSFLGGESFPDEVIDEYNGSYGGNIRGVDIILDVENVTGADYISESYGIDYFVGEAANIGSGLGGKILADQYAEFESDMLDEMNEMLEELGLSDLFEDIMGSFEDDPEDIKLMKIKHRNSEMKDIVKADADYLKALFQHYEEMKSGDVNSSDTVNYSCENTVSTQGVDSATPVINIVV